MFETTTTQEFTLEQRFGLALLSKRTRQQVVALTV